MTNNDILRRLRHALNIDDAKVVEIFDQSGEPTTKSQVVNWLKREEDKDYVNLTDRGLCRFLDGLVIEKRGPRPDGEVPKPQSTLTNNEILKKIRIAFEMRDEDMNAVFEKVEFVITKAELGSFFRKEGHRNYRPCPEQVLRKFLQGLGKNPE
jgi:uncharacterized protein YehS (DUF1456 family)